MKHYINIKILPDAEINEGFLLNKVYAKLHKGLFDLQSSTIGISFPKYRAKLGRVLRAHGSRQDLKNLQALSWLARMGDYCEVSAISEVPENIKGHRTVSRIQITMSAAKLRRLIRRGSISDNEIKVYKEKMSQKKLDNPYVELKSASNGHTHRRYIAFGELQQHAVDGKFDVFGLSKTATIPWF